MLSDSFFQRIALALASVIVSLSLLQAVQLTWFAPVQPARVDVSVRHLLLSLCVSSGSSRLLELLERDGAGGSVPASPVPGEPTRLSHDGRCALCGTDPDPPAPVSAPALAHLPRIDPLRWMPADALPGSLRRTMGRVKARAPPIG